MTLTFEAVEFRQTAKIFGAVIALRDINICFQRGKCTALIGPNGAGKSTLLHMAATLLRPTHGEVLYGENNGVNGGAELRGTIGFAADQPHCYAELTGHENLMFQARLHRLHRPGERVTTMVQAFGLEKIAKRGVRGYSQGEMRRLALARSFIHEPHLLLLDEPSAGLDISGTKLLVEHMRQRVARGAIVIVSTHDPWLGYQIADRVVGLRMGIIEKDEPSPTAQKDWRRLLGIED